MRHRLAPQQGRPPGGRRGEKKLARIPTGRVGRPEDLLAAAIFLASPEAEMVNGIAVQVDGGATIR